MGPSVDFNVLAKQKISASTGDSNPGSPVVKPSRFTQRLIWLQRTTTDFVLQNFVSDEHGTSCFCTTALPTDIGMLHGTNHNFRRRGFHCGATVTVFLRLISVVSDQGSTCNDASRATAFAPNVQELGRIRIQTPVRNTGLLSYSHCQFTHSMTRH